MEDATNLTFNMFDVGALIVIGLSALISFYRGFIGETLSLLGWLVAAYVSLHFLEPATELTKPYIKNEGLAAGAAAIGLFFITLILCSIVTGLITKVLKPSARVGLFDNLVGLTFGAVRGVLIVTLGFFIMSKFFTSEENYPELVKTAASRPYIEKCAKWISNFTPEYLDKITGDNRESLHKGIDDSKKQMNKAVDKMDVEIEDMQGDSPSIKDLQRQIREENERKR